jgi:hypothetical protein
MYGFSKACSGRIQDVAGLAVAQLPEDVGEKLLKHMNAAQIAGKYQRDFILNLVCLYLITHMY